MIYSPGNITFGNIFEILPFGNDIDLITVKGSTIMKALEKSVEVDRSGGFLQFSGKYSTAFTISIRA